MEAVIEWGFAAETLAGQVICGDGHYVKTWDEQALIVLMDGLGHGPQAAKAVEVAVAAFEEHQHSGVILDLIYVHHALRNTRGVCIAIASIDRAAGAMAWAGLGDVEGVLVRSTGEHHWLPRRNGVLGMAANVVKTLRLHTESVATGDLVMFATDGVGRNSVPSLNRISNAQAMAEQILRTNAKGTDDASVLVARVL